MDKIQVFSPATVANVSCGFDTMGFALSKLGDEMIFEKNDSKEVVISKITGADLPYDTDKNVVGVVAKKMLIDAQADFGLDIQITKNFKPGSGLGSSAASGAGTAVAVNKMLDSKFSDLELVRYGMLGEKIACGAEIADNVSAAIYGGFILVRSYEPLDIVKIPTPKDLIATVIHPQIEVKTEDARRVLKKEIPLKTAIAQWANVGGLVSGLYEGDFDLISRSLVDHVAEPARKHLIPHFDATKNAALAAGALGAGISGSGPSIFALSKGIETANNVADAMRNVFQGTDIEFTVYVSEISDQGVKIT